jgi:putative DNA primase/helicase
MEFLAAAVKTIPNTADTSRDTYVAVAHNIKGSTPPEYDQAGFDIFTEWASKYPAPDMQHDLKLWDGIDRDGISTGWDRIRLLAEDVGEWDGTLAAVAQAQAEFDVVEGEPEEYDGQLTLAEVTDHSILAQHISEQGRDYFTSGNHDWFVWNGVRWRPDPMKAEHTKGRIALQLDLIANELMDKYAGGKKVMTAINSLHSVGMINAVFARIGMQEGVYRDRDMLNHTEWYKYTLNTPTGTYDLRTMEVRDHQRLNYITQITSVLPDFDDQCPEFMKFLLSSCGGDEQLVRYVLAVLGASLTADTQDRYIWFLTGESGAGKSTLLKHVHAILGDYAGICPQGALVHGEQAAHQSAVAGFRDKRFIHGSEIDRGQKWNVALMKSITGNEIITARRLYHEYEEFTVVGKVIIAGNETPTLANVDSAVRERLRLIQFVAPEESDPKLDEKLRKEYPAILALLMKSAQVWIEEGYPHCEAVQTLTEEYFREEDLVGQFRDHYFLVTGTEAFVSNKDVHDLWEQFTTLDQRKEHNIKGIKTLSRALRSSDSRVSTHMQRIDGKVTRGLQGLTLRENINIPASLEDLM